MRGALRLPPFLTASLWMLEFVNRTRGFFLNFEHGVQMFTMRLKQ
jgi:hypothetical protein